MTDSALFLAVADAAVRGTLVLLAALAATGLMRRSSASARHLVWLAALAALLLLPLARSFVPEWRVLPLPTAPIASAPAVASAPASIDQSSASITSSASGPASTAPAAAAVPAQRWWVSMDWIRLALMVWAAGVLLFGLRLAYGVARIRWIERRATELTDDEWVTLTDGLARRLRLGRIVRLLREPAATVPMTWGVFHPVVLLPAESDQWEAERRRVVLAHELAHVGRWDAATQWIAHLALVVFWFNPLVWVAARKLREEREHACDDAVLAIGTRAADYADHLLDIVRKLGSSNGPTPALAMARRSQFEGRLLAILDNAVRRNGVSRTAGLATAAAALVCMLPLAALRPAPAAEVPVTTAARSTDQPPVSKPRIETPGVATALRPEKASAPSTVAPRVIENVERLSAPAAEPKAPARAPVVKAGSSDGDAAAVLREAIGRGDPGLYTEIIRAAEDIKSASARRMVLTGLLEKSDLSAANISGIVAATRTMDSDLEKRIVLTAVTEHRTFRASGSLPPAMASALESFSSSLEQRIVITGLWEARRWDTPSLAAIFRVVASVDSDLERRIILTGAAARQTVQGSARDAYLAAARSIDSELERGLALNALTSNSSTRAAPTGSRSSTGSRRSGTVASAPRNASGEGQWDSEIELSGLRNGKPCDVEIHASKVIFRTARSDIRRILPGGRLHLERRYDGHVHIVRGVPGEGGRPVFTYTVDGQQRPFEAEGRAWMNAFIREYTGV
ncbi:M56 family metallopeptidase [Longimicrobium sp.]|jgi:beta-lactamase regulating signal transducer with metallopeptidase domain|uniref:M56 family metallopeptidase n=1 Tax=Longimicrobium sp. TaxID=2029185 RepID=UPI002EDA9519